LPDGYPSQSLYHLESYQASTYFYSINIAQSMVLGETASWEDSQRQLIAKDINLLQSFQSLKYANGESQSFNKQLLIFFKCVCDQWLSWSVNLRFFAQLELMIVYVRLSSSTITALPLTLR
jgi:hypothetical protein